MNKNKLEYFYNEIMRKKHSKEEWFSLYDEVSSYLENCEDEEAEAFLDSGIGESLEMTIAAMKR